MARGFEVSTDHLDSPRFRLLTPDGHALEVSGHYQDTSAAPASEADADGMGLGDMPAGVRDQDGTDQVRVRRLTVADPPPSVQSAMGAGQTRHAPPAPHPAKALEESLMASENINDALSAVVTLVDFTASTGDGTSCSITLLTPKKTPVHACNGGLAAQVIDLQERLEEGPALTAITGRRTIIMRSTSFDNRWPKFTPSAAACGIGSVLAVPIAVDEGSAAVLTFSTQAPGGLQYGDIVAAEDFADRISGPLRSALLIAELKETVEQLYAALSHRTVIDMALGILIGQNHCDHETAFGILRRASSNRNIKVRDLAAAIVASASGGSEPPVHFQT